MDDATFLLISDCLLEITGGGYRIRCALHGDSCPMRTSKCIVESIDPPTHPPTSSDEH